MSTDHYAMHRHAKDYTDAPRVDLGARVERVIQTARNVEAQVADRLRIDRATPTGQMAFTFNDRK